MIQHAQSRIFLVDAVKYFTRANDRNVVATHSEY